MFNPLTLPSPLGCPLPKGGGLLSSHHVGTVNGMIDHLVDMHEMVVGYELSPSELSGISG